MPAELVKSFAKKTGKSVSEVEEKWKEAKASVKKSNPELSEDDDKFWEFVVGRLKKMLGIKENRIENIRERVNQLLEQDEEVNNCKHLSRFSNKGKDWDCIIGCEEIEVGKGSECPFKLDKEADDDCPCYEER